MAVSLLVVALFVVCLAAWAVAFAAPHPRAVVPDSIVDQVAAADRHVRRWRAVGIVTGMAVAVLLWALDGLGRGPLFAAVGFGLVFVLAGCLGELTSPIASGGRRAAALARRRPGGYLPRGLSALVLVNGGALVVLLVVGMASATADDQGRPGRSLTWTTPDGGSHRVSPWPGSFYAWPLLVVVVAELVLVWLALRTIAQRAQVVGDRSGERADDALRRQAARGVIAAVGVGTAFPLLGVGLVVAGASWGNEAPGWLVAMRWIALAAAFVGFVTFGVCIAHLLRSAGPAVDARVDERAESAESDA